MLPFAVVVADLDFSLGGGATVGAVGAGWRWWWGCGGGED